ncbi:MAG: ATP-dependent RecD-like DNA helicase [Clostridia bacterium]
MKIQGKVATIIFKSDKTPWTVILFKIENEYITAVGDTEDIEVEEELELDGEKVSHKVYGEQFKFTTYRKILPRSNFALITYISDNIKGIGKKTASNIVNQFSDKTVETIRYTPEKLDGIKGLNQSKIKDLNIFFNEQWDKWNIIEYLAQYGISVVVASKIYQILGSQTIDIVNENPYSLIGFVKNIDFSIADEIGMKMGIALDNDDRIDTGVIYSLNKVTEFGHTCIEYDLILDQASQMLNVSQKSIEDALIRLRFDEKIFMQEIDEKDVIFQRSYFLAEENIAKHVIAHSNKPRLIKDYSKEIKQISSKNNILLSDEQYDAISTCLTSHISIITGGPGTGKTTTIKCIIDILEEMGKKYVLCAPTGRAAKRITETTGKEAKTLHRLLEITKLDDNNIDLILEYQVKPVEADVIIIDEASMIDTLMMNNLLKAININTQIIMVGDVNQLPSVGPGRVLKDIIDSNLVSTVYLKTIYRQSAMSDIILNAHRVNNGEYLKFKNKDTDLFFVKTDSVENTISEISSLVSYRLESFAKLDIKKDMQVLTPMKKTELGSVQLNGKLQELLNPAKSDKKEKEFLGKTFREGDKVMQIINNYDKKFAIGGEFFEGIYNGDIGYISSINNKEKKLYIEFDDAKLVEYDFDELDQIEHAYAVTIHKSQGSEFNYVILPLYIGYPKLFTRNLLYTAMTRAKKMLIIVGSKNVLNYMVDNIDSRNRNTGLKEKIINSII